MSSVPTSVTHASVAGPRGLPAAAASTTSAASILNWAISIGAHGGFLAVATAVILLPGGVAPKPLPPLIIHPSSEERPEALDFRPPAAAALSREVEPLETPELLPPEDPTPRLPDPDRPQVVVSAEPLPEDPIPAEALTMRVFMPAREAAPVEAVDAPPAAAAETFSAPQPAQPIRIDYPSAARRRGSEGVVEVEITVDATGAVSTLRVAVSSGHPMLDEAALKGLSTIRFTPALRNGVAVPHTFRQPVRFVLREAP
jgi:protein TonB